MRFPLGSCPTLPHSILVDQRSPKVHHLEVLDVPLALHPRVNLEGGPWELDLLLQLPEHLFFLQLPRTRSKARSAQRSVSYRVSVTAAPTWGSSRSHTGRIRLG